MITRIAPTPSGFLHMGNVFNFLLTWLWARSNQGKVLLRIDDADTERTRPAYVEDIFRTLDKLGMDWDIGPSGPADLQTAWSQVHRRALYDDLLQELVEKNSLYPCTCSRRQLMENSFSSCTCSTLFSKQHMTNSLLTVGANLRMKVLPGQQVNFWDVFKGMVNLPVGNFVVRRKDGIPAYHTCSLADDTHFGITHIVRGEDLLGSTAVQLFMDQALDQPRFNSVYFWHHPLVCAADGSKFSKSTGLAKIPFSSTVDQSAVLRSFVAWMGWDAKQYVTIEDFLLHPDLGISC